MNVLVVAAHPDDEVLGAGGTLVDHVRRGDRVDILILSDGAVSRGLIGREADRMVERRRAAAIESARIIGVAGLEMCSHRDNHFIVESRREVTLAIEEAVSRLRPEVIYSHYMHDLSQDHRVTAEGVAVAARPAAGPAPSVLSFEVRSSTDWALEPGHPFAPNVWVPLDDIAVKAKLDALAAYEEELRPWPHSRSIQAVQALLTHRGAQVGVEAAEAFVATRMVGLPG
jgi:LmbE family N-acetylglucosaminyl deacetylase